MNDRFRNDDPIAPNGAGDAEIRAAFAELRDSAARLDTLAARRRLESGSRRHGAAWLAPAMALAAVVAVAGLGIGYAVSRERTQGIEAANGGSTASGDQTGDSTGGDSSSTEPVEPEQVAVGEIVDRTWVLRSFGGGAATEAAAGAGGFLRLDGDGTLDGGTGCRALAGFWAASGGGIEVSDLEPSGDCGAGLAGQDAQVMAVLTGGFTVELDGDRLTLTSGAGERLQYQLAVAGDEVAQPATQEGDGTGVDGDETAFTPDDSLTWSVILVPGDDVLNVRSAAGAGNRKVAEVAPDGTGLAAGDRVVTVGNGRWRQVGRDATATGWVNEQFLAASPAVFGEAERSAMVEVASSAIAWLTGRPGASPPSDWVSPTGVWIGGIGVYADFPTPVVQVPAAVLATQEGWTAPRDFAPLPPGELGCGQGGQDCIVSPLDFIKLPDPDRDYELLVDEVLLAGDQAGGIAGTQFQNGPVDQLDAMHHVTVDVPATSEEQSDWQRIHLFFDWRTGEPLIHAIYTWGWTP